LAGVEHNGRYPRAVEEGLIAEVGISRLRIDRTACQSRSLWQHGESASTPSCMRRTTH
jgi:hypothetical protein